MWWAGAAQHAFWGFRGVRGGVTRIAVGYDDTMATVKRAVGPVPRA